MCMSTNITLLPCRKGIIQIRRPGQDSIDRAADPRKTKQGGDTNSCPSISEGDNVGPGPTGLSSPPLGQRQDSTRKVEAPVRSAREWQNVRHFQSLNQRATVVLH
jgi:hypothetical protein